MFLVQSFVVLYFFLNLMSCLIYQEGKRLGDDQSADFEVSRTKDLRRRPIGPRTLFACPHTDSGWSQNLQISGGENGGDFFRLRAVFGGACQKLSLGREAGHSLQFVFCQPVAE